MSGDGRDERAGAPAPPEHAPEPDSCAGGEPPGAPQGELGDAAGEGPAPVGADLVRAALASARAAAREKGLRPGTAPARKRRAAPASSGDGRDPVLFGDAVRRLVEERGWQETTAAGRVLGDWDALVGPQIADHCRPTSLVDGELVLVAESSAWATQLRLLTRTLQARLVAQVGEGVVTSISVRGPSTPDWRKGPRRVRGRGPRDTYG